MTKTLDEKRPYGKIYPPHEGACFEQDGYFFDHSKRAIRTSDGKSVAAKAPVPVRKSVREPKKSAPVTHGTDESDDISDATEDWNTLVASPFMKLRAAATAAGYDGEPKKADIVAWLKETGRLED